MNFSLDAYMFHRQPISEVAALAERLGFDSLEISGREDFLPWYLAPALDRERIKEILTALKTHDLRLSSLMVLYRWASPDEAERAAAVRFWKRAIQSAVNLGCDRINTEFTGRPQLPEESAAQWWRSLDEVLPIAEKEGITISIEPHPDDFVEAQDAALNLIRGVDSAVLKYLYCAPHTFYLGDDVGAMVRQAGHLLHHVHVADTYNHKASEGLRYIVNPFSAEARVHQHNVIGHGEVDFDALFEGLAAVGFRGVLSSVVLGWNDDAVGATERNLASIRALAGKHGL